MKTLGRCRKKNWWFMVVTRKLRNKAAGKTFSWFIADDPAKLFKNTSIHRSFWVCTFMDEPEYAEKPDGLPCRYLIRKGSLMGMIRLRYDHVPFPHLTSQRGRGIIALTNVDPSWFALSLRRAILLQWQKSAPSLIFPRRSPAPPAFITIHP